MCSVKEYCCSFSSRPNVTALGMGLLSGTYCNAIVIPSTRRSVRQQPGCTLLFFAWLRRVGRAEARPHSSKSAHIHSDFAGRSYRYPVTVESHFDKHSALRSTELFVDHCLIAQATKSCGEVHWGTLSLYFEIQMG